MAKGMEDYRDDLVVIVAVYPDRMEHFINANPGFRSRFNKYVHYENYTAEDMLEIFKRLCDSSEFQLTPKAEAKLYSIFAEKAGNSQFRNARGVRNLFEKTTVVQAMRVIDGINPTKQAFCTIIAEDING